MCSFLPAPESYRARLLGWAAIPGYFRMFSRGLSRFCGVAEEEFLRRVLDRPQNEIIDFIEETAFSRGKDTAAFVADLGAAGYDRAVVFSIDSQTTTGAPPLEPEVLARAVAEHPDRVMALLGLDPLKKDAAASLERGVRELGLHGALLVPFLHGLPADSACYRPVYEKCAALDVPVWIHTSVNWSPRHPMELGHPRVLDRLCGEMPMLKVIAGHGGWPWIPDMVAAAWRHPNLYIDPSGHRWKYLAQPGSGWEMLMHFGNNVLQDKILFGTDWPLMEQGMREIADELRALPLRPEVQEKWLGGNAARFLEIAS